MTTLDASAVGHDTAIRNYQVLVRRYAQLLDLVRDLTSALHLNDLLERVALAATRLVECEGAVVLLRDPLSGELQVGATTHPGLARLRVREFPVESSLAGQVLARGEPIVLSSEALQRPTTQSSLRYYEVALLAPAYPQSFAALPLVSKDVCIGVLEAINRSGGQFSPEDMATLEALAGQAAVAVENMRLFEQSDLIAELVHEIRTPLTALGTAAALLDRSDLAEIQRHSVLSSLRQEIARLNELADEFLDLARLEAGRARFQPTRFSLTPLLAECAEIVMPLMHGNGLKFVRQFDPEGLDLYADRVRIKQVVLNLLSNAVKYNSPGGQVTLRARRNAGAPQGDGESCSIEVADSGPGIASESLPHIFERFYRAKEGEQRAQGTGLGLYIARHIVESHRGRIEVESRPGQGSEFRVVLPLANVAGRLPG
ncbi:MAG TPA: GAF domain-containing sensor histidine kinase [Anaerolineales bacterium]|nr:GAF domain-containing sensor histidine kinase [Anaerolineales bacterium]